MFMFMCFVVGFFIFIPLSKLFIITAVNPLSKLFIIYAVNSLGKLFNIYAAIFGFTMCKTMQKTMGMDRSPEIKDQIFFVGVMPPPL